MNQQSLVNDPTTPLWQEFFVAAQALAQQNLSLADKGLAIVQVGLHYRMRELYTKLSSKHGTHVQDGPFKGLDLGPYGTHMSACLPRWLGLYESALWPAIHNAINTPYTTLINIGAGEGYYAIGLAMRMPQLQVLAADTNPTMQNICKELSALNKVADRVTVCGEITGTTIADSTKGRTLIICDIEGAERELLNPKTTPALLTTDLIVELHENEAPGVSDLLQSLYAATHDIEIINPRPTDVLETPLARMMSEVDQFLLTYEGRAGPTPWGVFKCKTKP